MNIQIERLKGEKIRLINKFYYWNYFINIFLRMSSNNLKY